MKSLVFLVSFAFLCFASTIHSIPPSDVEVGERGPDDLLLFGTDFVETSPLTYGGFGEGLNITFVSVKQTDPNHMDAKAVFQEGGPGYDFFKVYMAPGPSGAYRYEVRAYGKDRVAKRGVTRVSKIFVEGV